MFQTVNGISLYVEQTGSGPPLLLLHGNGEDHHIFDPLAAKLSAHFTVYAPDSRNHGQSDKTGDYSYEAMTEDCHALIKALDLQKVQIAGFSDGAIIALMLAMRYPEVPDRLVLMGVNLSPKDFLPEEFAKIRQEYEETGDPLLKLMLTEPNIRRKQLHAVTAPCMLTAGEHDVFKPRAFQTVQQYLAAPMLIFSGHAHDSYVTGNDLLYPHLLNFLTGKPLFPEVSK